MSAENHEEEIFKGSFDEFDKIHIGDPMVNATDSIAEEKKAKRNRIIVYIVLALVTVLALGVVVQKFFTGDTTSEEQNQEIVQEEVRPTLANKPLLENYKAAPKATAGLVTTKVVDDTITATDNTRLKVSGVALKPSSKECKVIDTTDFCLVARSPEARDYDVYYLKDAAHSRLFEDPKDFQKIQVPGSPSAGTLSLDLGSLKAPALVTVNNNSSGWMIVFTNEKSAENLNAVKELVTLQ